MYDKLNQTMISLYSMIMTNELVIVGRDDGHKGPKGVTFSNELQSVYKNIYRTKSKV